MSVLFRSDGWVKTSQGPAVPGAQIFVCTQPANAPASLVPVSPSPQASIFSDNGGLVPITQPIITDGFGHYDFYAAAGIYTVLVYLNGTLQQQYPDQSIGGVGSGGGVGLIAGTNITIVGSVISSTGGGSSITLRTDGTDNLVQSILDLDDSYSSFLFVSAAQGKVYITESFPGSASILHLTGTVTFNNPFPLSINSFSITSNVLTLNIDVGTALRIAASVRYWLSGFSVGTYLNGQNVLLKVTDPVNGVMTGNFTHADVPLTTDSGIGCVPLQCVATYSGISIQSPPTYASPVSSLSNTGALWVEPDSNFNVHTLHSTNGSDANWVVVVSYPYQLAN